MAKCFSNILSNLPLHLRFDLNDFAKSNTFFKAIFYIELRKQSSQ